MACEDNTHTAQNSQEADFFELFDVSSGGLRLPITAPETKARLTSLNGQAASSIRAIEEAALLSSGTTLCQGACLLAGTFEELDPLESCWSGPQCELAGIAGRTLQAFKGKKTKQVRLCSPSSVW